MGRPLRMSPTNLHVLLSLAGGPAHAYGMLSEIEERSEGVLKLGPSSLYYALGRLEDAGLVEEAEVDPTGDPHEEQRRYFRLTHEGRDVLDAELAQLDRLVAEGRRLGFGRGR